jgi:hypothetical protein
MLGAKRLTDLRRKTSPSITVIQDVTMQQVEDDTEATDTDGVSYPFLGPDVT